MSETEINKGMYFCPECGQKTLIQDGKHLRCLTCGWINCKNCQ